MRRGTAEESLHGVMPMAAHHDHIDPTVTDELGNGPNGRAFDKMPALQRNLMMIAQPIECRALRGAYAAVEPRHGHGTRPEVGNMSPGRIAHMHQVQLGVALQGQRMGAVDHLFVQMLAAAMTV
ncbi:hypothetical protein D3C76_754670 [compost metagenome]